MSGKIKQKDKEEDLEELQENEVDLQEQEYDELQCHMCSEMFTNVESLRHHMRKRYSHCVNCSKLFWNENDLKCHKKKCNICEQCGKEKHNGNCMKQSIGGNKRNKKK